MTDMFDTMKIGKKIAELRKQKDMTQFELADAMGVSFQAVSNWERGNSMPDISKLTELSEILGTTVDELLGKSNPVVEKIIRQETLDADKVSAEDVREAAEIAKPSQVEWMAENGGIRAIAALLPFLGEEYIDRLADRCYQESGQDIAVLLPFVSCEKADELMKRSASDGRSVAVFLPFASEEAIAFVAGKYREEKKSIAQFLPFMKDSDVREFAEKQFENGGMKAIAGFLPFLDEKDVERFAEKLMRKK
mgnify:CR=1 FL=1